MRWPETCNEASKPKSFWKPILPSRSPDPLAIATALTTLTAGRYNELVATDYILHLVRPPNNVVVGLLELVARIKYWCISTILNGSSVNKRSHSFALFVQIATVRFQGNHVIGDARLLLTTCKRCYEFCDYSTAAAIVQALESTCIAYLGGTISSAKRTWNMVWPLSHLSALLHQDQYIILEEVDSCIPRIGMTHVLNYTV